MVAKYNFFYYVKYLSSFSIFISLHFFKLLGMITYITGKLIENPAYVIETAGEWHIIYIFPKYFSQIKSEETLKLLTHYVVKEDSHLLYGFIDAEERSFSDY